MAGAERTYFCCIGNANLFGIMFRNPLQDGFQPSGIRRFRRKLLFSMQNEQSQKTQQSALDDQFIAWKFGAVGIFDFLQTVRRLRIIQIIRRQMYVQCQTPALQRKNILFGTQISCTTQKFGSKIIFSYSIY